AVDEQTWRGPVDLGEDPPVAQLEDLIAMAADQLVRLTDQLLGNTAAHALAAFEHEQMRPDEVALDDGEQDGALLLLDGLAQPVAIATFLPSVLQRSTSSRISFTLHASSRCRPAPRRAPRG